MEGTTDDDDDDVKRTWMGHKLCSIGCDWVCPVLLCPSRF